MGPAPCADRDESEPVNQTGKRASIPLSRCEFHSGLKDTRIKYLPHKKTVKKNTRIRVPAPGSTEARKMG